MGSTLISSPLIVQHQTDDLSLLQSLSSALNHRNKMSTSMGTGNRRKQKHSNLWVNMEEYSTISTMSVTQGSSPSSSTSSRSDMTLPTPPRSPSASVGFEETMQDFDEDEEYSTSQIPEPLLDDLLELWCEETDFTSNVDGSEEISINNALTELGFDPLEADGHLDSMSESERAENMIDHLLATLSPPPTNPSSPKMQADSEFEESETFMVSSVKSEMPESSSSGSSIAEEIEEEVITGEEEMVEQEETKFQMKIERGFDEELILPHGQQDEVLQNLIDNSGGLMSYEMDEQLLENMDKFDEAYTQMQAMSSASSSAAKSVEKFIDSLKLEPTDSMDTVVSSEDAREGDEYDLFGGEPQSKKGRYDFEDEFLNEIPDIKHDCMWNAFLGGDLSPSTMSSNWKQEYTFETLFDEENDKLEVVAGTTAPGGSAAPALTPEESLKAAQKEAEAVAAAAVAAEDAKKKRQLEEFRIAFDNDHRYALAYDDKYMKSVGDKSKTTSAFTQPRKIIQGIIVKSEPQADKVGGGAAPKKTKILVPLKDLMETLQQKSFLVSPLGPNKKIIRFTGSDSVKGVLSAANFQSTIVATQCSSPNSRTITTVQSKPNHNVRKRPHTLKSPKIEITSALSPLDLDGSCSPLSSSIVSSTSGSSSPSSSTSGSSTSSANPTKKKTKAHNNMERMRRIDLRNSFENLKKLVPPLAKIPKCSKVEILRRAEEYIKNLRGQEKRLQKEEMQVRQRNAQLRSRLEATSSSMSSLTSSLSSSSSSISCTN